MKKLLAIMMSIALVFCLAACGEEKTEMPEKEPVQTTTDTPVQDKTDDKAQESTEDKQEDVEVPVIESADELEDMVNEFNDTEDPERKEELRQQLEAILSQAEQAAQ